MKLLIVLLLLSACATKPTPYQSYKKKVGGYQEEKFADDLKLIVFKANSQTKKGQAELFAKFRAVEVCHEEGFKAAHILGVFDKSESREVTRSSSNVYGFPSYYYGMYPYYGRYYSGFGFGFDTIQASSWNETYVYPEYDVLFACANTIYEPEAIFREVPADEMKHLVMDLKGAVQVEKLIDHSPNERELRYGDIILKSGDKRIEKNYQVIELFKHGPKAAPLEILRDGKKLKIMLKGKDVTESVLKSQSEIVNSACHNKYMKKKRDLCT